MKKVYSFKENRKLRVGEIYDFYVVKRIKIPGGDEYFVLQDPFEEKHLLPAEFYKNYEINKKRFLKCHVDKVNCKGQIFLEPLHPRYSLGNCYEFKYLKTEKSMNRKGILEVYYIMKGHDGQLAYLPTNNSEEKPENNSWKRYKILKIKKAKLFLGSI